jgi:hypothetical protein
MGCSLSSSNNEATKKLSEVKDVKVALKLFTSKHNKNLHDLRILPADGRLVINFIQA